MQFADFGAAHYSDPFSVEIKLWVEANPAGLPEEGCKYTQHPGRPQLPLCLQDMSVENSLSYCDKKYLSPGRAAALALPLCVELQRQIEEYYTEESAQQSKKGFTFCFSAL